MIVIGQGRVGAALLALDPQGIVPVDRSRGWEALTGSAGAPVLVATRNDALAGVVQKVPAHRQADLVFVQNGMLRPWLVDQGLSGATRGILFFAVQAKGDAPTPGGVSPFYGPQAGAVVAWMQSHGLPAREVSAEDFARVELEKLAWNCIFGVMGQATGLGVGTIVQERASAFESLSAELLGLGARALQVEIDIRATTASMAEYAQSISAYQASVKEWPWRNGWFVQLARADGTFSQSQHADWLERAGAMPSGL